MTWAILVLAACTEPPAVAPLAGELLITELYTSGAVPAGGTDHYYSDQFIELGNATDHPLDLSGVRVADLFGTAGEINPGGEPNGFASSHPDEVVMETVWMLPDGVRLEPGEAIVVAHDGTNHRPFSTVDLSGAAFEAYVVDSERDEDSPTVPNLENVDYNGGYDWLMTVFGPSVVLLDATSELTTFSTPQGERLSASADAVLDGVDTLMDADSEAFKRLPDALDAGFAYVSGTYSGESLHRLRDEDGWVDSNDSSTDFEVGDPDPARSEESDGVTGTPELALGTGTSSFVPLADGDSIELVAGPQGGWHLDTTLWFTGFGPGGVTLVYEALDASAARVSFETQAELVEASVVETEDGWHRLGDRIVLNIANPSAVVNTELILRVTAALDGQTWSDERRVTVVDAQ